MAGIISKQIDKNKKKQLFLDDPLGNLAYLKNLDEDNPFVKLIIAMIATVEKQQEEHNLLSNQLKSFQQLLSSPPKNEEVFKEIAEKISKINIPESIKLENPATEVSLKGGIELKKPFWFNAPSLSDIIQGVKNLLIKEKIPGGDEKNPQFVKIVEDDKKSLGVSGVISIPRRVVQTSQRPFTTFVTNKTIIAASGAPVQLASGGASKRVTVAGLASNKKKIFIGDSTVNAANEIGIPLYPSQTADFHVYHLGLIWLDAEASGEGVSYINYN